MKRSKFLLALLLVVLAVVGFQTGVYHEFQRLFSANPSAAHDSGNHDGSGTNSTSKSNYIEVNTIINYGNKTIDWFNHTRVPEGWNFYNLTLLITNGRVDMPPTLEYNEHFILGINGVKQNATYYWSLWKFCPTYAAWALTPVGVDEVALSNNGIYGWYFQLQSGTQYPPVAGARTVTLPDIASC